ncbi:hypothetical protein PoB_004349000 [Plakobranchus ocellatus]|uniref:Uncharacterized protein n=1 Tax=Plakobranchus ocellatus TaxID=259542 RepID=A0AAV4BBR9_9GAST|nr:hypothetical protein PoB_004349000 [Plakobranchus ocellatus]
MVNDDCYDDNDDDDYDEDKTNDSEEVREADGDDYPSDGSRAPGILLHAANGLAPAWGGHRVNHHGWVGVFSAGVYADGGGDDYDDGGDGDEDDDDDGGAGGGGIILNDAMILISMSVLFYFLK